MGTTWKEFLSQHWELMVAADFFTVEVWTAKSILAICFRFSQLYPSVTKRLPIQSGSVSGPYAI
jgi:hypothetical protein